jgi:signal transduction histidine kinase
MESHLRSQQKLESVGVLASGVAHEINNPLNGILNYGQVILDAVKNEELNCNDYRDSIATFSKEIIKESDRISGVVGNLLQFARTGSKRFVEIQIADIINNILNLIDTVIKQDQIVLEIDIQPDLPKIECRSQEIQQVLLNLIINAKDALNAKYKGFDEQKTINVNVSEVDSDKQKMIRITVRDNGNGIPKDIGENIFDPFFTTKSRSEGTGLGLYISFGIVKDHGGKMSFITKQGKFTQFIVDLPVKQKNEGE